LVQQNLAESKSDARRKMEQGGVSIDDKKITDISTLVDKNFAGKVLRVGKKDFARILFE